MARDKAAIKRELLDRVDSLYAEYGDDVTRADIEEQINDVFYRQ